MSNSQENQSTGENQSPQNTSNQSNQVQGKPIEKPNFPKNTLLKENEHPKIEKVVKK